MKELNAVVNSAQLQKSRKKRHTIMLHKMNNSCMHFSTLHYILNVKLSVENFIMGLVELFEICGIYGFMGVVGFMGFVEFVGFLGFMGFIGVFLGVLGFLGIC